MVLNIFGLIKFTIIDVTNILNMHVKMLLINTDTFLFVTSKVKLFHFYGNFDTSIIFFYFCGLINVVLNMKVMKSLPSPLYSFLGACHYRKCPTGIFYSTDEDLSNSLINKIYQDKYDYIWIATEDGLNKFDGMKFSVYKNNLNDSTSLKTIT